MSWGGLKGKRRRVDIRCIQLRRIILAGMNLEIQGNSVSNRMGLIERYKVL